MMAGIGFAKVIGLLALPFLADFYSSAEFGVLGVYISIVLIFKTFANGGYEVAILLPEESTESAGIFSLCHWINNGLFIGTLLLCFSLYYFNPFPSLEDLFEHLNVLLLMPFSIWLEGKAMALKYWLNRSKIYEGISNAIMAQAFVTIGAQFLFAFWLRPMNGLVLGLFLGEVAMYLTMRIYGGSIPKQGMAIIRKMSRKYSQFLRFGLTGNLVNALAHFGPYVLFQRHFGATLNGQFTMSNQKVLAAPINLIAAAISPVFYESANRASKEGGQKLRQITLELSLILFLMILPLVIVFVLWGPQLFVFFFGEDWVIAGQYARYLAPFMAMRFVVNPLSYLIDVKLKLKQQLAFNVIYLLSILCLFGIFWSHFDHFQLIKLYALSSFIIYFVYFLYLVSLSKNPQVRLE